MFRYVPISFLGFIYVGPGARLVASLEGRGAQLWRRPGSKYFRSLVKWSLGLALSLARATLVAHYDVTLYWHGRLKSPK